jgi:acyl carrier protein
MSKEELVEKIYSVIGTAVGLPRDKIQLHTKISDLSEDSIQLFELVLAFEREFGLETKYDDLIKIQTVGDIVSYLESQPLACNA